MAISSINSILFIIAVIAIGSTASLPMQSFIGSEDATTTTRISTPLPMMQESPPPPTTTVPMPGRHTPHQCDPNTPDRARTRRMNREKSSNPWLDRPEDWFVIIMMGLFALPVGYCIVVRLLECCHYYGFGRTFYWMFRDSVCCGFCVRRMRCGQVYEYEAI